MECCRPNPPCQNFCRLDGRLISGKGFIRNSTGDREYEVLKTIAYGGMSTTYLTYDYHNSRLAVLKEIDSQLAKKAKARELFEREATMLRALECRGIPKFYDFFATEEQYSLVMEMIHGQNLELIQPVDSIQAIDWMLQLCEILDYLHGRNPPIIHRDIKPANLILRYNPREIVLIDFGAVKEATAPPGTRIVTPGYGAPEQQQGIPCIQSDFYGVGTTLIYLLTKQSPRNFFLPRQAKFEGLEAAGIPRSLVKIISVLTALSPLKRPQNAREAISLLQEGRSKL